VLPLPLPLLPISSLICFDVAESRLNFAVEVYTPPLVIAALRIREKLVLCGVMVYQERRFGDIVRSLSFVARQHPNFDVGLAERLYCLGNALLKQDVTTSELKHSTGCHSCNLSSIAVQPKHMQPCSTPLHNASISLLSISLLIASCSFAANDSTSATLSSR
jgi:hypothetical protein